MNLRKPGCRGRLYSKEQGLLLRLCPRADRRRDQFRTFFTPKSVLAGTSHLHSPTPTEYWRAHISAQRGFGMSNQRNITCDFSSCFFPIFKIMHFQNDDMESYTVVLFFVFSQFFNKILLSLELEPQINCQQLPRTRVSVSLTAVRDRKSPKRRLAGSFHAPPILSCRWQIHQIWFRSMVGRIVKPKNKSPRHSVSFQNKVTLSSLKTY